MGAYLIDNPPRRSQFKARETSTGVAVRPSGAIILHTAESVMDQVGPDTGAEAVARFIQGRTTPGSYHDLVDSDSIVDLVPYHLAAFQDGTGSNPYALSISFACRTTDWPVMSEVQREAFLHMGAEAFRRQQHWLASNGYPLTPVRRITAAAVTAKQPGLCYHGDRDPGRRTDPGMATFPFDRFAVLCVQALGGTLPPPPPPPPPAGAPPFPLPRGWYFGPRTGPRESVSGYHSHREDLRRWQRRMAVRGWKITADGLYGPGTASVAREFQQDKGLTADGLIGAKTWAAAWTAPIT